MSLEMSRFSQIKLRILYMCIYFFFFILKFNFSSLNEKKALVLIVLI